MLDSTTLANLQALAANLVAEQPPAPEPEPVVTDDDTKIGVMLDIVNSKAHVFERDGKRMIDLSRFTDAELGAIFRKHFTAQIAANLPAKREAALAEVAAHDAAHKAGVAADQERRKGHVLPAFMVGDLEVPALDLSMFDLNTAVDGVTRSPYNKARNRLTDDGPLPNNRADDLHTEGYVPTTYAVLEQEHLRLMALAATTEVKAAPAQVLVAENEALNPAALALVESCGMTYEAALALL